MAYSHSDIADRWARSVRDNKGACYQGCENVFFDGDEIYSYGGHFCMARAVRKTSGEIDLILVNGDRYSVSTTRHQGYVRSSIRRYLPGHTVVTIPFTALNRASILPETIRVLGIERERYDRRLNRTENPPQGMVAWGDHSSGWFHGRFGSSFHSTDEEVGHPQAVGYYLPADARHDRQFVRFDGTHYLWYSVRHWLGDAVISAKTFNSRGRRVKFISSFDRQELNPLYFFCQLPPTKAETLDEALEALKPEPVRLAEIAGRSVARQGDMFAVPVPSLSRRDLTSMGATFARKSDVNAWLKYKDARMIPDPEVGRWATMVNPDWSQDRLDTLADTARAASLIGTSHTATEVATLPDGTQYARGSMYHMPHAFEAWNRRPDHSLRKMGDGKTWHLIVKNTVPVADMRRRGARVAA